MRGEREAVRVSSGDFRLSMTVYPNESPYYPETDMIDFMLKKKGKIFHVSNERSLIGKLRRSRLQVQGRSAANR